MSIPQSLRIEPEFLTTDLHVLHLSSPRLQLRSWLAAILLAALGSIAHGDSSLRNGNMAAPHGGGTPGGVSSQTSTAATVAAAQAAVVAANAQAAAQRSLQALQALQAAQGAARQTALANGVNNLGFDPNHAGQMLPNVPDGIAAGGLMPAGGATLAPGSTTSYNVPASWTNVSALSQSGSTGPVTDTVAQSGQQALLYWSSFNVGRNTTLKFDQSAGQANVNQWVAINEIQDPSLSPSQILGSIQAQGQVYVINQNGIIFGGSSQVNVHALVASSLALNPDYIANGLLNDAQNNYEFQFSDLVSEITQTTGPHNHRVTTTTVSPLWAAPTTTTGVTQQVFAVPTGNVTVQPGAQLSSSTDANHDGGRIALIAPNVVNQGTISTPDGQTILAAGDQVSLVAHASDDPSLRGVDVFVGQVSSGAGTIANQVFTFNGLNGDAPLADDSNLPGNETLTFAGTGQVGTYTPVNGTATPIMGGVATTIPLGSQVSLTGGSFSFAAAQGGAVTNAGDIESPRADVMLTGQSVSQLGVINDSTSVTLNGRVDLLADYNSHAATLDGVTGMYPTATGPVIFGGQSLTQILPELSDPDTVIGAQLALPSLVDVQGSSIEMQSGSLLYAPSASASAASPALNLVGAALTSGVNFQAGTWYALGGTAGSITTVFSYSLGTIALDPGATLDVSGSENVADSVSQNIVAAQLRGPELADSTLQQNGALRGDTVLVNLQDMGVYDGVPWIGTPLGDVSGYVDDVEHTVGQLTTNGGTVALDAGTSVTLASGSAINVSGGWINYAGALVQTSKVVTEDGQLLDISQALPDVVYQGVYNGYTQTFPKYGISHNFQSSLLTGAHYETGYLQGGSGGALTITAPAMTIDGTLEGNTVAGPQQQTPIAQLASTYAEAAFLPVAEEMAGLPEPSTLDLSFFQLTANFVSDVYSTTSPNVSFENDAFLAGNIPAAGQLYLSQDLVNTDGFGNLSIDTSASGTITVGPGAALIAPYGGDLNFLAADIDIYGSIAAPGQGSIILQADDIPPSVQVQSNTPAQITTRGQINLYAGAALSADGLLVADQTGSDSQPLALNGGTISLAALTMDLQPGSAIDVSGGAAVMENRSVSYGHAGSISILGGEDPQYRSLVAGGSLILGSTLSGYSGEVGGAGSLTIQAPLVQIGGASLANGDSSLHPFVAGEGGISSNGTTLWINEAGQSDFFSEGGFGNFDIEGLGQIETDHAGNLVFDAAGDPVIAPAVLITAGTVIKPVVDLALVSSSNIGVALTPLPAAMIDGLLPSQRSAASLVFDAEGVSSTLGGDGPPLEGGGISTNSSGGGGVLVRGDLVLEPGALIETDPQTNSAQGVKLLAGNGTVAVLGDVVAPGGTIIIQGGSTSSASSNQLLFYESSPTQPFPTVDLGPNSLLSAAGVAEASFNALGYDTGSVLNGGQVVIGGNIVGEAGSVIDVSGANAVFDEPASALNVTVTSLHTPLYAPLDLASNGGSISLNASQLLMSDSTLLGDSGGPSAEGGSLSISANFPAGLATPSPIGITLVVEAQGPNGGYVLPAGYATGLAVVRDQVPADPIITPTGNVDSLFVANPNLFSPVSVDGAMSDNGGRAGGFASLNLAGTVEFQGPVTLDLSRSLAVGMSSTNAQGATGGVIYATGDTVLSAPYVALNINQQSYLPDLVPASAYPTASAGPGSLTVDAGVLADVGNISLQNIGTLNFNTTGPAGAIRGDGTLQVDGTANLTATQIYPSTEATFTVQATTINVAAPAGQPPPALPISGGGTLNLDATTIDQAGVLRAPLGTINLGTSLTQNITLAPGSITSVSAVDPLTGGGILIPYGIIGSNGDWYDPDGNDITVAGNGAGGLPAKAIHITGQNIDAQAGSTLDITGGGELFAYSFLPGTGGNRDILGSTDAASSFAILPGYNVGYAPAETYAQNNNLQTNGAADQGYFNANLAVGEQIYLNASPGLPAGFYTLLPARYALLPGAFLVSPGTSRMTAASTQQPDGSDIVSGYVTNGLQPAAPGIYSTFEVDSQALVLARAPYAVSLADPFFAASAAANGVAVPRLPRDAGQVVLNAGASMVLAGSLLSQPAGPGLGGEVDIASSGDIYIVGPNEESSVPAGALALDAAQLSGFGAASLLIGGYRTDSETGTQVTVTTDDLVVDNAGSPLRAPDLTLVSSANLTLSTGAEIEQVGSGDTGAETFYFGGTEGDAALGAGDGAVLRVSGDTEAQIVRSNVNPADLAPDLAIGASAVVDNADGGPVGSLILDSTAALTVNTSASLAPTLSGNTLTLDSGSINIELGTPVSPPSAGLVVTAVELQSFLDSTQSLSFLSYSSIALFGSGEVGSVNGADYQEASIALHADDIYYADTQNSAGIAINAGTVTIDNLAGGSALPSLAGLGTTSLTIQAQTVNLGSGNVRLDQFGSTTINASSAIVARGLGAQIAGSDVAPTPASLTAGGNLVLATPLITAGTPDSAVGGSTTTAADEAITATGSLTIQAAAGGASPTVAAGGLGATLSFSGASIDQTGGLISAPSGTLNLTATSGDITLNGALDAGGMQQNFYGLLKYTNGGGVALSASAGSVTLGSNSTINVSAASGLGTVDSTAGNAGSLIISAPEGTFIVQSAPGALDGAAGEVVGADGAVVSQGTAGSFTLDAGQLSGNDLSALEAAITTTSTIAGETDVAGFVGAQSIRLRNQSITVDGTVAAENFSLSTDKGSITVGPQGRILATAPQAAGIDVTLATQNGLTLLANPGATGGSISLAASGSVVLEGGSLLSVAGQTVNDAGKGGSIDLAAGSETVSGGTVTIDPAGYVSIASGAMLDLRTLQTTTLLDGSQISGSSGTLNLRAPQILSGGNPIGVQVDPVLGTIVDASAITVAGYNVYQPVGGVIDSVEADVLANGAAFSTAMGTGSAGLSPLFSGAVLVGATPAVNVEPEAEIINPAGSLTLESSWDLSTARFGVNNLGQALPGVLTLRAAGDVDIDFGASLSDGFTDAADDGVLLPEGSLSWSYRIVSGADLKAADVLKVQPTGALAGAGSLVLGYQTPPNFILLSDFGTNDPAEFFQAIRTGVGSIDVAAGGNVELVNNLATIYTAGTQVDPTLGGAFSQPAGTGANGFPLPATYSEGGGNVTVTAQGNIAHYAYDNDTGALQADSSDEMPTNWLDREGSVSNGQVVLPTTWWVDFTNYFEGIGALGGGNVTLQAGGSVINVDADVPTNARMVAGETTELGGGDLTIKAGNNIDGGVYYVERGQGTLTAGGSILTNSTRATVELFQPSSSLDWLPTTLFLGKGGFVSTAGGNLLLGPVVNPFLLPQSYNNIASDQDLVSELSYFSTYASTDFVDADSLTGTLTIKDYALTGEGSLAAFYENILNTPTSNEISDAEPWLKLAEAATSVSNVVNALRGASVLPTGSPGNVFQGFTSLMPPTLRATANEGDIDVVGSVTLSPSATGTLDLLAEGSIDAFELNVETISGTTSYESAAGVINVSDANPAALPSVLDPVGSGSLLAKLDSLFTETGATVGLTLQTEQSLHADINNMPLHAGDLNPAYLYAVGGSISGLTAFVPKETQVIAGTDLTDIGLYLQNDSADDVSVVEAGRDILAYDATSPLRIAAGINLDGYNSISLPEGSGPGAPDSGDIQISGPGDLEVIAGRNLTLGDDSGANPNNTISGDGLFTGLTSVGDQRNPALPSGGADLIVLTGVGAPEGDANSLSVSGLDFSDFISQFVEGNSTYLTELESEMSNAGGPTSSMTADDFDDLSTPEQDALALQVFFLVLRDAGRAHNDPNSPDFGTYGQSAKAISTLFSGTTMGGGAINLTSREVATTDGGNISLLLPGGALTVGIEVAGTPALSQGVITVDGGNISIFAHGDVNVGSSRIFTLHGGNEIIWSSEGNIDAGASSKTVVSAPPTRVVVDPTSGDVETDLAGLATGGGIGVLASVAGVPPGDVDLIAPEGVVDAGDAGIRATGNLNIAAVQVLNASNIQVGGKSTGVPTATSVNIGAISAASSVAGSSQQAASTTTPTKPNTESTAQDLPSLITVEVIGYGGGDNETD